MGTPEQGEGIAFIQSWYASCCDGEWEHEFAVRIATLDNPGWHLEIDVVETGLEGVITERTRIDLPEGEWMITWSDGEKFHASCGVRSLGVVDEFFRRFAERKGRVG
ncbi:Imm53 family immunity protein [Streptomyces sp. NPDC002659]|uniref:Imm53 family immunity protein n=1 Tax=Streptomyces sp. NPDC002659 TaxID=3364656 RepID=UPI0036940E2B